MKQYFEKIDQKQLRMLLAVAMLLILFCAYQFGYVNYNNKTTTIEDEIVLLQQRSNDLSAQLSQEAYYQESVATCQANMKAIMDQYGPGNTPEKSTKFLIDLSSATGMKIPTVSFSQEEQIFASTTVPSSDGLGVYAYHNTLSITYNSTYQGLKDSVDFINNNSEKMNIQSLTASFDSETGNLSGAMIINLYSMTGTGKTYVPPVLDGVSVGNSSIFGTYEAAEEDTIN
jgi:hypothetical protein